VAAASGEGATAPSSRDSAEFARQRREEGRFLRVRRAVRVADGGGDVIGRDAGLVARERVGELRHVAAPGHHPVQSRIVA